MADLATYKTKVVLHTPRRLLQNDTSDRNRRVVKARMYRTRSTSKQPHVQVQQTKTFLNSDIAKAGSVKRGRGFKISRGRKHDSQVKYVSGRHKVTCEACRAYGTLIECDTCTSSWHSQCVRLGPIPDPASPPAYWRCPKCLEKGSQTVQRLATHSAYPSKALQGGGKKVCGRVAISRLDDDNGRCGTSSGLQEVQQCCLNLSKALQQDVEKSQSIIQVLQEALDADTTELVALKAEAHRKSRELEEIKIEKERITAELNQIMVEDHESTGRMAGIMRIVEGFFVHRRNV